MKVISGGQTGVDRAALEVAYELGFPTGGTCPAGCRTDEGPDLALVTKFKLIEHASAAYPPRTHQNVANSDFTVWFGVDSAGKKCTRRACKKYSKRFVDNPNVGELLFLLLTGPSVVNVAGNRRRTHPASSVVAQVILRDALTEYRKRVS